MRIRQPTRRGLAAGAARRGEPGGRTRCCRPPYWCTWPGGPGPAPGGSAERSGQAGPAAAPAEARPGLLTKPVPPANAPGAAPAAAGPGRGAAPGGRKGGRGAPPCPSRPAPPRQPRCSAAAPRRWPGAPGAAAPQSPSPAPGAATPGEDGKSWRSFVFWSAAALPGHGEARPGGD